MIKTAFALSALVSVGLAGVPKTYIDTKNFPPAVCKARSGVKPPAGIPSLYPEAKGTYSCPELLRIKAGESFDGKGYRFDRGAGFRPKDCTTQEAKKGELMFELEDGATLKNVIIGREVNDAVYCKGACTIENVWWEEICEDALTGKGKPDGRLISITGGAARGGTDKCFQFNAGGTMSIKDFDFWFTKSTHKAEDVGKFYRSCGGCGGYTRHVVADNIRVHGDVRGEALVGLNAYNGDTAKLSNIQLDKNTFNSSWHVCKKWNQKSGNHLFTYGPDSKACLYKDSDVKFVNLP